ncbi:DEAD/DEAH box helicase [Alsobacter sp. SYSU M60028]|uniref:DEAD/DEAH box helicase n=1 Tax=Alsobacter ponti TaxID=2962936 RepID=A0ABT1LFS1_9HYPH|nr:DEAD/DEAH box helicase [Alsobacter ponti]MCP8940294.1 DEAD/DEAH box helicase [Alsobacter ponti]
MNFSDLGLSQKVLEAVTASGYTQPTPIQEQAIPEVLARRDVLGIAQTGTGKTAAFTLPMLTLLEQGRARARMPRTLILEPTRELAAQVEESFNKYGAQQKLNVALLIGGVSFGDQDMKITRGVDVLIATPGRLLDHFERGKLLLTGIEILVIDEADRMLDMGFIPDIERICRMVPFTRQTLFFSATMPPEIQRLTETFLHNPVRLEVARQATTASTITQRLIAARHDPAGKREVLRNLVRNQPDFKNAIIFCNRKRDVQVVHKSLERHGFNVAALHGDMDQRARMAALEGFRSGATQLLVASDVAARGLDIPDVSHVFNFDVPHHAEDYVHRIGRTGRAGRKGTAYTIVTSEDGKSLAAIEHMIGNAIEWDGPTTAADDDGAPRERRARTGERRGRTGGREGRGREDRAREDRAPRGDRPREDRPREERSREERPREERPREERAAAPAPREPRPERSPAPARAPRGDQARDRKRPAREDRDEAPVIGLGDHVPPFLLRSVRTR